MSGGRGAMPLNAPLLLSSSIYTLSSTIKANEPNCFSAWNSGHYVHYSNTLDPSGAEALANRADVPEETKMKWANIQDRNDIGGCAYPKIDAEPGEYTHGHFLPVTEDCKGAPIDEETQGKWFKLSPNLNITFRGKMNTAYHYAPRPMEYDEGTAYCRSRGMSVGVRTHMWCPNGTNENNFMYWYHPNQPLSNNQYPNGSYLTTGDIDHSGMKSQIFDIHGLWTGITRRSDWNNFDWWCDYDLYPHRDYFRWARKYPYFMDLSNNHFSRYVYINRASLEWHDIHLCDLNHGDKPDDDCKHKQTWTDSFGVTHDDKGEYRMWVICEMNCDNTDRERYVDWTTCPTPCEDKCWKGNCECDDPRYHVNPDTGNCIRNRGGFSFHFNNGTNGAYKNCPYYPESWHNGSYQYWPQEKHYLGTLGRRKREAGGELGFNDIVEAFSNWYNAFDENTSKTADEYMADFKRYLKGANSEPELIAKFNEFTGWVEAESFFLDMEAYENEIPQNDVSYYEKMWNESPPPDYFEVDSVAVHTRTVQHEDGDDSDDAQDILIPADGETPEAAMESYYRRTNYFGTNKNCPADTFVTFAENPLFEEHNFDCAGNPIVGESITRGGWWRPKIPFAGKEQSIYHAPHLAGTEAQFEPKSDRYGTDRQTAFDYCYNWTGLWDLGMPVGLHCPNSTMENHILWMSHPDQPFHDFAKHVGLHTGIVRTVNTSAEHYWCNSCMYQQTYFRFRRESGFGNAAPGMMGGKSKPWYWNPGQIHDDYPCTLENGCAEEGKWGPVAAFENFLFIRYINPDWGNTRQSDNARFASTICEMNCKYYEEPCDPCAGVLCPGEQYCFDGQCICNDDLATWNPFKEVCEVDTNTTCPCDDPSCIVDLVIEPDPREKLKEHGCHCVKLGPLSIVQNYVGGAGKVDEIDAICKRWFDARRCIQLNGGSCYGFDLSQYDYTLIIEGLSHVLDCSGILNLGLDADTEKCLHDLCLIDVTYSEMILYGLEDVMVDWTSIIVTEADCPSCKDWTGRNCIPPTMCVGDAPWVKLVK